MKMCYIYQTKKEFIIVTNSESVEGITISDEPIFVLPIDIETDLFLQKVKIALNSSRYDVIRPPREKCKERERFLLDKMGQKSFSKLYRTSCSCCIKDYGEKTTITPYIYYDKSRPGWALKEYNDEKIEIRNKDCSDSLLFSSIIEALEISKENK